VQFYVFHDVKRAKTSTQNLRKNVSSDA